MCHTVKCVPVPILIIIVNKGSLVIAAQETTIQHILFVFVVVTKFYDKYLFQYFGCILVFKSKKFILLHKSGKHRSINL
jgi:hypothetical protein